MSTTVSYKGSVIATISNTVKKLLTKGKYLEDDITITDSGGGGSANLETLQVSYTPSETAISDTQTPSTGYDGFDEAQISVAAIPSSYVGSGITRRDSTDMSVSGDTVTAPAGYYENAGSKAIAAGSISLPQFLAANRGSLSSGSGYVGITKTLNITPSVVAGYIASGTQESVEVTLEADVWTVGATNYHPSTSDQTIPADSFLRGAQTIKAVVLDNLLAENIKNGVTVKVGDDTDDDCVAAVTGTYEGSGGWTADGIAQATEPSGAIILSVPFVNGYNAAGIRAYAFYGNTAITSIELTTNPNIYAYAFAKMTALTSFSAPNATKFGNHGLSNSASVFEDCTALTTLSIPKVTTLGGYVCRRCTSLVTVALPAATNFGGNGTFSGCTALETADLGAANKIGNVDFFSGCTSLTTVILRSTSLVTLSNINNIASNTPFKSGGAGGTIYIPKSLFDHLGDNTSSDYKKATNWSTVNGYGTITWKQIEGSYYETHYADGTLIP